MRALVHRCCAAALVAGLLPAFGCNAIVGIEPLRVEDRADYANMTRLPRDKVDKIDLLFVVDDSFSMETKQYALALLVPDLVERLTNPPCVDPFTREETQTVGQDEACPDGTDREFPPVTDMNVGVITTSLGGAGSTTCEPGGVAYAPAQNARAHMVSAKDQGFGGLDFLNWDPDQRDVPPGEDQSDVLQQQFRQLVGVGTEGCGYAATLESWYRFLVDPAPYEQLVPAPCEEGDEALLCVAPDGVDDVVLEQRKAFLRQDSLLVIVMLTDGLDCSVDPRGRGNFALEHGGEQATFHLPPGTSACAQDPWSADCKSCWELAPGEYDPACEGNPEDNDPFGLRCWDQKRRFGRSYLYPVRRYVDGLTSPTLEDGTLNPVFCVPSARGSDPSRCSQATRSPGNVLLVGIVGVPWQDLARNPDDLAEGYRPTEQLSWTLSDFQDRGVTPPAGLAGEDTLWRVILGETDPSSHEPIPTRGPLDPHMVQSEHPRSGVNPLTGQPIPSPTADPLTDPIHGREVDFEPGQLQPACLAPHPEPEDCAVNHSLACICSAASDDPRCWDGSAFTSVQHYVSAVPSKRPLAVIKAMGAQGVVASICWADTQNESSPGYGYRPALENVVARVSGPLLGNCVDEPLDPDDSGRVPCKIFQARPAEYDASGSPVCAPCDAPLQDVPEPTRSEVQALHGIDQAGAACVCEIPQVPAERGLLDSCVSQRDPHPDVAGWCYVDPALNVTASEQLVGFCPDQDKRLIRFVGENVPSDDATLYLKCYEKD